jgi:hypothetical protein
MRGPSLAARGTSRQGQGTLIGLLVVVAIIILVVWWLWLRPQVQTKPRFAGEAQTPLGQALQKGQSVDCAEYLRQMRTFIQMEHDQNGVYPPALDQKWGLPLTCPVSNLPYKYDPTTGRVWDQTPGHEGY